MKYTACTWSRDLNTHFSCPRTGKCGIHICSGPKRGGHVLDSEVLAVMCLGCGCGLSWGKTLQAAHIMCRVSGGIHSPRADAELLGPAKILGFEAAKQTLEINKQVLRHLRVPVSLFRQQCPWAQGPSWGSKSSITQLHALQGPT